MNILVTALVQRQIRSTKALKFGHSKGQSKDSILLLICIIIKVIILNWGGLGDVFIITNSGLLFISVVGPKIFLFLFYESVCILKTDLRMLQYAPYCRISGESWASIWVDLFPLIVSSGSSVNFALPPETNRVFSLGLPLLIHEARQGINYLNQYRKDILQ